MGLVFAEYKIDEKVHSTYFIENVPPYFQARHLRSEQDIRSRPSKVQTLQA